LYICFFLCWQRKIGKRRIYLAAVIAVKVQNYMPKVEKLFAFIKMLGTPGISRKE
jgi:hypothetical protein